MRLPASVLRHLVALLKVVDDLSEFLQFELWLRRAHHAFVFSTQPKIGCGSQLKAFRALHYGKTCGELSKQLQ